MLTRRLPGWIPWAVILILLAAWWGTSWWAAEQAAQLSVQAVVAQLEAQGYVKLARSRPTIPDLPDGAEPLAHMEAASGPSAGAPVHQPTGPSPVPIVPGCPAPAVQPADLAACLDRLGSCQQQVPASAFLLVQDLEPDQLGVECRADLVRDPGGDVHGRLHGLARLQLDGADDGPAPGTADLVTDWRPLDEVRVAAVAPDERPSRWQAEIRAGLYGGTDAGLAVGATWYGRNPSGPGARRRGWWANAQWGIADQTVAAGASWRIGR